MRDRLALVDRAVTGALRRDRLALDRASVRIIDPDSGHLHVSLSNISRANVCEYGGFEVPDGDRLGLDARRVYRLLRDPAELAKTASTFEGKPLLMDHRALTADTHSHALTVGAVHGVRWNPPHLQAALSVWDGTAIAAIRNGSKRALSCGYSYDADMTPGIYQGERYDGVMRNLRGNHVSLVEEGRAGPSVIVGDNAIKRRSAVPVNDPATISECLAAVVDYLRQSSNDDAGLNAIADRLAGGGDDPDGPAAQAADRALRLRTATARAQASAAVGADLLRRFPNAHRLMR